MLLSLITENIKCRIEGGDVDISSLTETSAKAEKGSLFVCIKGTRTDGHNYAEQAVQNGAAAVMTTKKLKLDVPQIIVSDTRVACGQAAANFYGNPAKKMKIAAVTGTNGKTTVSHMIAAIAKRAGMKTGLIGTNGIYYDGKAFPPVLTTPDPIELHKIFADMYSDGCEVIAMEVSAHAIYLEKMSGIVADVGIFTNLSLDHLDFFETMDKYSQTKRGYFSKEYIKAAVINSDDETGRAILKNIKIPYVSYGNNNPADVFTVDYKSSINGSYFVINLLDELYEINLPIPARYNMYNCLAAAGACHLLGIGLKDIAKGIEEMPQVPGRYNTISGNGKNIIIDYAHSPDGLKNVLESIKEFVKGRIISVFGCGGNRDTTKRAVMGKISGEIADYTIITSDNPRFEDADAIAAQVECGIKETASEYEIITDRRKAIKRAIELASPEDIVLIAGKGHEDYQEIMGVRNRFLDSEEVEKVLKGF